MSAQLDLVDEPRVAADLAPEDMVFLPDPPPPALSRRLGGALLQLGGLLWLVGLAAVITLGALTWFTIGVLVLAVLTAPQNLSTGTSRD